MIARATRVDVDLALRGRLDLLHHPPRGVLRSQADVRGHDGAPVPDRRIGDRHLQRIGLQIALADGEVHVVAVGPGPVGRPCR